jgi:hypothetical protein
MYAAANQVFSRANLAAMKLEAIKYYYIPNKDIGVAGIVVKPTPKLLKLQKDLIAAIAPFTVKTGDSFAFVTTPDYPIIDPALIGYVSTFVPKASGKQSIRTSPPASPSGNISTKCWPNRLNHSRFHPLAYPSTS